jgi:hypothetical protein
MNNAICNSITIAATCKSKFDNYSKRQNDNIDANIGGFRVHILPQRPTFLTEDFIGPLTLQSLSLSLMLRPTVSRPVYLGIKHPSGAYDQIFITLRQLRSCSCGALSLTRGRVCRLQLLLALTSAVILGSGSCGTRDHILLSQIPDFPFGRLLRLAGLRWRSQSLNLF